MNKDAAPVVHLDTFKADSENKLLALHGDGTVTCYSADLKTQEWQSNLNPGASNLISVPVIQAAATLSVQQARETILSNREDILAKLRPDGDADDRSLLLVMTCSPTKDTNNSARTLEMQILHINTADAESSGFSLGVQRKLQPIAIITLPEPSLFNSKKTRITMHTASGTVYQQAEGALAVYDLAGSFPRLVHTMVQDDVFSYLRLSSELVATSRGDSLSVVDLLYGSLQDECTMTLDHGAKVTQKSNKPKNEPTTTENLRLLSYYAPLGIIVALYGRQLLAVQLSTAQRADDSRKRKRGLLINSIGRSSSSINRASPTSVKSAAQISSLGTYLPSCDSSDWKAQRDCLDRCVAENDGKEFERLVADDLGMKSTAEDKQRSKTGLQKHIDQHTISYVLKSMFSIDQTCLDADPAGDNPRNLSIRFFPKTVGKWLIDKGFLTMGHIETSLKQNGALPFTSKLASGSLIRALATMDSSMEIVLSILASPIPMSSQELVHVLVIVTQRSNSEATEVPRLLTNGNEEDGSGNESPQLVDGQNTDALPSPFSILPTNNLNRRLLNLAIKRLYACPSSSVARALKRELSTSQLRILVDSLRMEIARSGWLSPYEDSLEPMDPSLQDDSQMCSIAHLLGCVIDSLGTGGWILGNSMSDEFTETADTVAYIKAEISAALEGIEEATYLKGMLGEILLCGKDSLNPNGTQSKLNETRLPNLPAKPKTMALDQEYSQLLPLGLKPATMVSTTKVGAGGELLKRSRRDIGRLKSRMVGKYSYDRIIL